MRQGWHSSSVSNGFGKMTWQRGFGGRSGGDCSRNRRTNVVPRGWRWPWRRWWYCRHGKRYHSNAETRCRSANFWWHWKWPWRRRWSYSWDTDDFHCRHKKFKKMMSQFFFINPYVMKWEKKLNIWKLWHLFKIFLSISRQMKLRKDWSSINVFYSIATIDGIPTMDGGSYAKCRFNRNRSYP